MNKFNCKMIILVQVIRDFMREKIFRWHRDMNPLPSDKSLLSGISLITMPIWVACTMGTIELSL